MTVTGKTALGQQSPSLPRGERGSSHVARAAASLLCAALLVCTYHFAFYLTKPSPLSIASVQDLLPVVGYMILLAVAVSGLLLPLARLGDIVARRVRPDAVAVGTVVTTSFLYAAGVLTFTENLVYTSAGIGLKTDDSPGLKIVFGVLALSVGLLLGRRTSRMRPRTGRAITLLSAVAGLLSVVTVTVYLAHPYEPPALEPHVSGGGRLVNVVILSSDGINADHMSVYGYHRNTTPFLRKKAEEFQVFDNAFANNGNTTGSITALLTGVSPLDTGVVLPPDALRADDALYSLPHLLGRLGYYRANWAVPHYADAHDQNLVDAFEVDNGVPEAGSLLGRLPLGPGPARWYVNETLDQSAGLVADVLGIRELQNPYSQVSHVAGDTISDRQRLQAVRQEIRDTRRLFANTHFLVSHGPGFTLAHPAFSRGEEQRSGWQRDFYDDSILQFDSYVRSVYVELNRSGRLDDTLLIVTSDHGAEHDATQRVPLLVRYPHAAQTGRVDVNVERLDIAPTVLDVLGYDKPAWMSGQSLVHVDRIPADRQLLATTAATAFALHGIFYHSRDGGIMLTVIRCGAYANVQPDGSVERGRVAGTTATCDAAPKPPVDDVE